jgi:hypothetical protein
MNDEWKRELGEKEQKQDRQDRQDKSKHEGGIKVKLLVIHPSSFILSSLSCLSCPSCLILLKPLSRLLRINVAARREGELLQNPSR